ncbi:hypothetical protein [Modestobacter sp. SSW1-42]|uniref:hypothetical protein n=1 Tax=Modestobacter sp. SSW1-42 TaxID=596372 RepID=UPI003987E945
MRSATARRPRSARARARLAAAASAVGALLLAVTVVWQSAAAGFTTTTPPLTATAGAATITLADDDAGSALFSVAGLKPGDSAGTRCITVRSTSSRPVDVQVFVEGISDRTLAGWLDVGVRVGTSGGFAGCTGFRSQAQVFSGRLTGFPTRWATGQPTWTAAAAGQARTYEVTLTLDPNTPTTAQGRTAAVTFVWEGRTS